ncbi:enoyl-CoA hydratase/isomerase family protein [Pseudovibrio exalbescens]|uniref:enoyl-CoA hydratase/isomerase family protein n=1 Tax=Pseudovibrio exalbescens TaxID=197461 RepID=UPI002365C7F3|nr:enoyl-CoA hydratase/isomerase family protein [Pseudovibrio exalbescens]MDD7909644.1 enoyl-CoA hydratase/isomerase family protein [Pseudovibrio exalbescens]
MTELVKLTLHDDWAEIRLNRPERHNALVPEVLDDLHRAIEAAKAAAPRALVLTGEGRSFSTGGDVGAFLEAASDPEQLRAYSERVVGGLHDALMKLLAFPAPVIARVNGPVTGGSVGFVLASDMVIMSQRAFVQPYYGVVGFGPDGGWTALLPEKIRTARALEVQYLNTRLSAEECVSLGLASRVVETEELDTGIQEWLGGIREMNASTLAATRANVWDAPRRAQVKARLDQEKARFLERISAPDTREGMQRFTNRH